VAVVARDDREQLLKQHGARVNPVIEEEHAEPEHVGPTM